MQQIHLQYFKHCYAEFVLGSYDNKLCLCDYRYRKLRDRVDQRIQCGVNAVFTQTTDCVLEATKAQLEEYFLGERDRFDIPILLIGSDFQKQVWDAVHNVKYGDTTTYQKLGASIGNEQALRAIGNANGANALAIIIPCHRILGSHGGLVGYSGGLPLKKRLLALEQNLFI